MIEIRPGIYIYDHEIELVPIRAQGAGGQNVNKVSSAVHLRFDIRSSALPEDAKERLLNTKDQRISSAGVIVIKGQRFRTQEKNRADATERLIALIAKATRTKPARKATKPSKASKRKRLDQKARRGQIKNLRGRVDF